MKILAISQFYTPDITAAAFRISETVDDLQKLGNDVEVVTTFPHKSEVSVDTELGNNRVHRVRLPNTENKGFLGYIYLYLSFFLKSISKGFRIGVKQKPDVIWASSPPIFVGLAGWVLARSLGGGFALDIRDIWPDSAVAAGQISDSGFAYSVGRFLEKFLYRHADIITCVAMPMQSYIQQFTDTDVEVIYNGMAIPSVDTSQKRADNKLERHATDKKSKSILYAGNLGHVQQLDLLISAYSDVVDNGLRHTWEVFFIGDGAQKENLMELANSYDLTNRIHFLDPVPKHEVFDYLESADILFIHLMNSKVLKLTIPSKVFDYMLANRPLLAGIHGEGKKIIDSVQGNVTFRSGDKEQLIEGLKTMDENASRFSSTLNNAEIVKVYYSRESQSKKLNRILIEKLNS